MTKFLTPLVQTTSTTRKYDVLHNKWGHHTTVGYAFVVTSVMFPFFETFPSLNGGGGICLEHEGPFNGP